MNKQRQPEFRKYATPLDRKAKIAEKMHRRSVKERGTLNTIDDDVDDENLMDFQNFLHNQYDTE
jgi:hypothetical protein